MPRTKQSHDLRSGRTSSCSLRRTWTICTHAQEYLHKRWYKFTATFSLAVVRAALFHIQVGAVHLTRLPLAQFNPRAGDRGPVMDAKQPPDFPSPLPPRMM